MRKIFEPQMKIGQVHIEDIDFDLRSRDEITQLLIGFQALSMDIKTRNQVFEILDKMIPDHIDRKNGRPGMPLWTILILGTLRLVCNWDYDKLHEIANNHIRLRMMLLHTPYDKNPFYGLQTIKDNISLFTPEILDKINTVFAKFGQLIAGKKEDGKLYGSCDSFPGETNVHFPTDINLLFDALRKTITIIMALCGFTGLKGWREGKSIIKKAKKLFMQVQRLKRSTSKDEKKKSQRAELVKKAHLEYIEFAQSIVNRAEKFLASLPDDDLIASCKAQEIRKFIGHAERQNDQIRRRVIEGESIPHHEKVFSIFQEHTKWIKKGKAGVPQQLGLNICIVRDQYGFILHHIVMETETDDKVAVPIILGTLERFPDFAGCSFDKGFHSPANQIKLAKILDRVVLPRKGRLSKEAREIESSPEFKEARRKHSAVESSISALKNHGLDRCPDHGIDGFKRYIALGVLARNIQIIGRMIQEKERKRRQRSNARLQLAA
ncbi:MAG: ISNCY family transposase [Planctomycetaceae bacterium]|nr:ISNCY family transposase [Planctomycetaceae bacterium]